MCSSEHWPRSQDPIFLGVWDMFYTIQTLGDSQSILDLKGSKNSNLFYFNSVFPILIHLTNESLFGVGEIGEEVTPINIPQT